jgi:hypothetical protein
MLASAATLALIGSAARARGLKWDWAVAGVLSTFVYLYVVCVTCAVGCRGLQRALSGGAWALNWTTLSGSNGVLLCAQLRGAPRIGHPAS